MFEHTINMELNLLPYTKITLSRHHYKTKKTINRNSIDQYTYKLPKKKLNEAKLGNEEELDCVIATDENDNTYLILTKVKK